MKMAVSLFVNSKKSIFFAFPLIICLLISYNSTALHLDGNGGYKRHAKIEVILLEEDPDAIAFYAYGPQTITFASEKDSGWTCRDMCAEDITGIQCFSEVRFEPTLNAFQKFWARVDNLYYKKMREKTIKDVLSLEKQKLGSGYVCTFSFVPSVTIDPLIKELLADGIRANETVFRNTWEVHEAGKTNVSWGYLELEHILSSLASESDFDDKGFWVRDVNGNIVFRCQNDGGLYPCWHADRRG